MEPARERVEDIAAMKPNTSPKADIEHAPTRECGVATQR
jgi:hypothetical protein